MSGEWPVASPPSRGLWPARTHRPARSPRLTSARRWIAVLAVLALPGCGSDGEKPPSTSLPSVSRTATDGPVTIMLTVTPGELAFTERADVVVEVFADKNVTVEVEEYDRAQQHLEHQYEYRLTRRDRQAAVPTPDGRLKWTYRYDVQFFLPGEYEFPSAVASFVDWSASPAASEPPERRRVQTESLAVRARDPSAKTMSPEELRKITTLPPVELPRTWGRWGWLVLAGLAVAVAAWMLLRRRARPAAEEIPLPAHEWAQRQLAALVADDPIGKGRVREFYYRISGIVRGYIERRFGVSAPEMTTEEFLTAAASDGRFGAEHTGELQRFLTACDLVKYARLIPQSSEADRVLAAAGAFVERTREDLSRTESDRRMGVPREVQAA